jgi:hypothetical protein
MNAFASPAVQIDRSTRALGRRGGDALPAGLARMYPNLTASRNELLTMVWMQFTVRADSVGVVGAGPCLARATMRATASLVMSASLGNSRRICSAICPYEPPACGNAPMRP